MRLDFADGRDLAADIEINEFGAIDSYSKICFKFKKIY